MIRCVRPVERASWNVAVIAILELGGESRTRMTKNQHTPRASASSKRLSVAWTGAFRIARLLVYVTRLRRRFLLREIFSAATGLCVRLLASSDAGMSVLGVF